MNTEQAILVLRRRMDYLEKKCLPARLVGKPWFHGEVEIFALEMAIASLAGREIGPVDLSDFFPTSALG